MPTRSTRSSITDNAEARALALEAARKSVVLLKNDGVLPLQRAVAEDARRHRAECGARRSSAVTRTCRTHAISVLDGIKAKVGERCRVVTAEGVRLTEKGDWHEDEVVLADPAQNRARIKEAVQVAQGADAIVLVIGGSSAICREAWAKNHLGDRADLGLIGEQDELARAMFALGKPVVVVLINGQPLSIPEVAENANALLEGWYPGQEGGTAMADILFGDTNPGGKLPITIARSVGQLPMFYNQKPSAHRGYHFANRPNRCSRSASASRTRLSISARRACPQRASAATIPSRSRSMCATPARSRR